MSDYTTFKSNKKFNDSRLLESIGPNLSMFIDWGFLNIGAVNSIKLSTTDIRNSDKSRLQPVVDPNFTNGKVWQTPFKNLVWEQNVDSTTSISGVYVNSGLVTSGYKIDYRNGRVVFDTAIPTNAIVKMEYSNKLIDIKEARESNLMQYMITDSSNIDTIQYSSGSGQSSMLSQNKVLLPHIGIEISPSVTTKAYELGSFTEYRIVDALFHVFTDTYNMNKKIQDIVMDQGEKTIFLLDLDKINKSGNYSLDINGYKNPNAKTYEQLCNQSEYREYSARFKSPYISANTYLNYNFKDIIGQSIHHCVIRIPIEIIKTF